MAASLSLPVLLAVVAGGVVAVVALTWAVGWSAPRPGLTVEEAVTTFAASHPEARVVEGRVDDRGHCALLRLTEGAGLVFALGDRLVVRDLRSDTVQVEVDASGLWLRFGDLGSPPVHLVIADDEAREHCALWLGASEGAHGGA